MKFFFLIDCADREFKVRISFLKVAKYAMRVASFFDFSVCKIQDARKPTHFLGGLTILTFWEKIWTGFKKQIY